MDDIRPSWMNIVLLGQISDAVDEYRSHQMSIICCTPRKKFALNIRKTEFLSKFWAMCAQKYMEEKNLF
jgi:hypothetical protein